MRGASQYSVHAICLWRGSPNVFPTFFSPPAHLCAAKDVTEISLNSMLSYKSSTDVLTKWQGPGNYILKLEGGGARLGYCFTPYQRLWLYNGAPLVTFYDTLGIRRTYSRLKSPASSRGGGLSVSNLKSKMRTSDVRMLLSCLDIKEPSISLVNRKITPPPLTGVSREYVLRISSVS